MSRAPRLSGQIALRRELCHAERCANIAHNNSQTSVYYADFYLRDFHHWMGRRRFLIKELVKVQIKEFKYD